MKKIVNIVTQMEAGGAQQVAVNIDDTLKTKGYYSEIWFLYMIRPTYQGHKGVQIVYHKKPSSIIDYICLFFRLVKRLHACKPEVVITHTSMPNVLGQVAAFFAGVRARIAVQHNPVDTYSKIARFLDYIVGSIGFYKQNIIVSKVVLESVELYPTGYKQRMKIINYGIPMPVLTTDKEKARHKLGLPLNNPIIVNVGRLAEQKNQLLLLQVLKCLPNIYVVIAGDGELRSLIEKEAYAFGVSERLILLGEISPNRIANILVAGDVFVFPSVYESAGLAMVEAMQIGIPVVASDIPGIREVLEDEEGSPTGILVHPNDGNGFCQAVTKLLEDSDLTNELISRAKVRAKAYDLTRMVYNYEQCFLEVLSEDEELK